MLLASYSCVQLPTDTITISDYLKLLLIGLHLLLRLLLLLFFVAFFFASVNSCVLNAAVVLLPTIAISGYFNIFPFVLILSLLTCLDGWVWS